MNIVHGLNHLYRNRLLHSVRDQWAKQWKTRKKIYDLIQDEEKIEELLKSKNKFFVLGSGRSGTQMLSGLLNLDKKVLVLHEPAFFEDRVTRNSIRNGDINVLEYLTGFRKYLINNELKRHRIDVGSYGEVTGTLRYHAAGLREAFPEARFLMLARDGRDVVRSIMQHNFYTKTSVKEGDTSPLPGSQYFNDWNRMTRFEKVCWLWADGYEDLLKIIPETNIIYFEKIIKDYSYCESSVFLYLNIQIDHDMWKGYVSKKSVNAIKSHEFDSWNNWSQEYKDDFDRICGPVMKQLGYEYKW